MKESLRERILHMELAHEIIQRKSLCDIQTAISTTFCERMNAIELDRRRSNACSLSPRAYEIVYALGVEYNRKRGSQDDRDVLAHNIELREILRDLIAEESK